MELSFPFELKSLSEAGSFEGLASVYGNVDDGGDVVERGAFVETLQKRGAEVPIFWSHDSANPVGLGTLTDTAEGLRIKGQLDLDVQAGREAYSRLRKRIVKGLSIGYRVTGEAGAKFIDGVRHLFNLQLFEVSLCALPMNAAALVTAVKTQVTTIREFERFLHQAGWSKSEALKLASHGWPGLAGTEAGEEELTDWLRERIAAA